MKRLRGIRRDGKLSIDGREALTGYLFILPWLVGLGLFVAYPLVFSLYMSFNKVRVTGQGMRLEWTGMQNWSHAFLKDNQFPVILANELIRTLIAIPVIVLFALFVSLMLNVKFPGRMLFRALFFLPVIFATGSVLGEIFFQGAGGLAILEQYDIRGFVVANFPRALAEPILGVLNMIVLIMWYSGVQVLIFLAGMQTIGAQVYEAARIDGATVWEMLWKITLPGLMPFIVLNIVYTLVDMSTFPFSGVMAYIVANLNTAGFGYISALGWIYFTIMFAIILIVLGLFRKLAASGGGKQV